jgi:NADH-quinone oxidoreductase subunit M
MLLAIMAMYWTAGTTDIRELLRITSRRKCRPGYGSPSSPVCGENADVAGAHLVARCPRGGADGGSVILAGILLKLGGYGFLRFSLPMFPLASEMFAPLVFVLSVVAIIYTSLVALMQEDIKKLIAYSSVAHMGYVTMGIFAANQQGVQGAHLPDAQPRLDLGRVVPLRRRCL